uniref:ascorbate ferrireductase (transmembrane) n=1 Tax=Anopheles farauti TaxID=69004 RepID=A0A182Q4G1_9DIPT
MSLSRGTHRRKQLRSMSIVAQHPSDLFLTISFSAVTLLCFVYQSFVSNLLSAEMTTTYGSISITLCDSKRESDFFETLQNNNDEPNSFGGGSSHEIRQEAHASDSYRTGDVHIHASMGGEDPADGLNSAENEQLFADYRDDDGDAENKGSSEETSVTNGGSMERSKRNGTGRIVNNRANERNATLSRRLVLANVFINSLMFGVAGYITYHCFNKAMVLFSWHPAFMSTGYLILMSQAVLTMSGANIFTYRCHHRTKVFLHWLLQAVAGVLITIASVCIFLNKIRLGKPHFQTLHGIFGLVTVCLTLVSIAGGVTTKYAFQLRNYLRPIYSKLAHGIAGTVVYLLGVTTISLGVYSRWFQEDNDASVRLTLVIAIGTVALFVVVAPIVNTVERIKTAARTTL